MSDPSKPSVFSDLLQETSGTCPYRNIAVVRSFAIIAGIGAATIILVEFQDSVVFTLKIPFTIPSPFTAALYGGGDVLLSVIIGGITSLFPAHLINHPGPYETMRKGES
jgi:hypothetical protein